MPAYLNKGSVSLDAGNWSDATGFANNATLVIERSNETLTQLDRTGDTTTGVDYLHFRRGAPIVGPTNGHLKVEYDATPSTTGRAQLLWDCDGGVLHAEFSTSLVCLETSLMGSGKIYLHVGECNTLAIKDNIVARINEGCDISTDVFMGGGYAFFESDATFTLPNVYLNDGHLESERRVEQCDQGGGIFEYYHTGALTTYNQHGGLFIPHGSGTITTWNYYGGEIDDTKILRDFTVTNLNNRSGKRLPRLSNKITVTTLTDEPKEV